MRKAITFIFLLSLVLKSNAIVVINPGDNVTDKIQNAGEWAEIMIMPGTYEIPDQIELLTGQYIYGIGPSPEDTVIKLDSNAYMNAGSIYMFHSDPTVNNLTIVNLTLDCNTDENNPPITGNQRMSILLEGNHNHINTVVSKGTYGHNRVECFCIKIKCGPNGVGNSIVNCKVSDVVGNNHSGIGLQGQGTISGCHVQFELVQNFEQMKAGPHNPEGVLRHRAYNCEWANGAVVQNNTSFGGTVGYFTDTGEVNDLTVKDNTFESVAIGVHFSFGGYGVGEDPRNAWGLDVLNNTITINSTIQQNTQPFPYNGDNWAYGIWFNTSNPHAEPMLPYIVDITVDGNSVKMDDPALLELPCPFTETGLYWFGVRDLYYAGEHQTFIWLPSVPDLGNDNITNNTFTQGGAGVNFRAFGEVWGVRWGINYDAYPSPFTSIISCPFQGTDPVGTPHCSTPVTPFCPDW